MFRMFGWERNWSRTLPAFIWFNPPFFSSVWLCLCVSVCYNKFLFPNPLHDLRESVRHTFLLLFLSFNACERMRGASAAVSISFLPVPTAPNWNAEWQQALPARRLEQECKLIWIDVIPGEINAFFNSCNYAPHVNSSRDLHEVIVGATSTDAFLLRFN